MPCFIVFEMDMISRLGLSPSTFNSDMSAKITKTCTHDNCCLPVDFCNLVFSNARLYYHAGYIEEAKKENFITYLGFLVSLVLSQPINNLNDVTISNFGTGRDDNFLVCYSLL